MLSNSKNVRGGVAKLYVQSLRSSYDSSTAGSGRNRRPGEKPAIDLASYTRSAKFIFPSDFPLHYLECYQLSNLLGSKYTCTTQEQP